MSETKKFEIEFTELCDEYEVEVANFNEFYNKVVALAIQVQARVSPKTADGWVSVLDKLPVEGKPVIIETNYGKHDICYLRVEEMMTLIWVNAMRPQHTNGGVIKWKEIE